MENVSRQELFAFLHANTSKTRDERMAQFRFPAKVVYFHHEKTDQFLVEIRVETSFPHDGELTLRQENGLSAENLYVDFNPRFQKMRFDRESNTLVIEGSSKKIAKYKVTISTL